MLSKSSDLEVVGLTEATDLAVIEAFRTRTGASYPMLYGVEAGTKAAYEVTGYPSLRIVDQGGKIIGRDAAALDAALAK